MDCTIFMYFSNHFVWLMLASNKLIIIDGGLEVAVFLVNIIWFVKHLRDSFIPRLYFFD